MLGDIGRRPAVLAAEREALQQTAGDEQNWRHNANAGVAGQETNYECRDAHHGHGDQEGVLAADKVAEAAEEQGAERTHRKAGGEAEQREDEARRRVHA